MLGGINTLERSWNLIKLPKKLFLNINVHFDNGQNLLSCNHNDKKLYLSWENNDYGVRAME